jgi:hypothetical protein
MEAVATAGLLSLVLLVFLVLYRDREVEGGFWGVWFKAGKPPKPPTDKQSP